MDYSALIARLHDEQTRVVMSAAHRYKADEKGMPGVTTICKVLDAPQLDNWRVKVQVEGTARAAYQNPPLPNEPLEAWTARLAAIAKQQYENVRIAKEAANEGTEVHSLIEWRMRKMLGQELPRPVVSDGASFREAGWEKWAKDAQLRPLMIEGRIAHREHRYCGTFDLLALVEGKLSLWDWKRQPRAYESHHLQSIGYRMALESIGAPRMPGYALLMPEGSDPTPQELDSSEETRAAFLACLTLYRWKP